MRIPIREVEADSPQARISTASVIAVRNLSKTYEGANGGDRIHALRSIDLEVAAGEIVGLLGENGAGKSTFINILAGLTIKDSGSVAVCGYDLDGDTLEFRRSIGIVPQELSVDPLFTPYEMLDFQAGLFGLARSGRRIKELLTTLGLGDKIHTPSRALSGGMKRRVMIGKALVHSPPVVVLDEPTAGVDIERRRSLWKYIVDLNRANKTTILLTTHYLEEAEELCDKIAIIHGGELITYAPTHSLISEFDNKKIDLELAQPLNKAPTISEHATATLISPLQLSISYNDQEVPLEKIMGALLKSGVKLKSIQNSSVSLEEAFRNITKTKSPSERFERD